MNSAKAAAEAALLPKTISNSLRPLLKHPQTFKQVIRQTDGSTFRIKTTSPKAMQTLTKDTLNHHLWNPAKASLTDSSGQLEKFTKRFGSVDPAADSGRGGLSQIDALLELAVGEAPKITEKKVVVKVVETAGKKGKAKAASAPPAKK